MKWPMVSIIIATYNSARTLDPCLSSIRSQDYPQKNIEIILVDGGSTDNTAIIGKKHNCIILSKKGFGAEAAKSFGLIKAKGEIIADFGSDNIIPHTKWLQKTIRPFLVNDTIIGTYPLRYTYREQDTVFNRYVGLFGVNDPVPFYLEKADRQSVLYKEYSLAGQARRRKGFWEVLFNQDNLPTVGANGFFIRTNVLKRAQINPNNYSHIDVIYDIVKNGYNVFAIIDDSIIHDTADTLFSLIGKRRKYMRQLYLEKYSMRRYHIVRSNNIHDLVLLGLFILYSITIIQPLILSVRGFMIKRDVAWFVHPIFCLSITLVYAESIIAHLIKRVAPK